MIFRKIALIHCSDLKSLIFGFYPVRVLRSLQACKSFSSSNLIFRFAPEGTPRCCSVPYHSQSEVPSYFHGLHQLSSPPSWQKNDQHMIGTFHCTSVFTVINYPCYFPLLAPQSNSFAQ